MGNMPAVSIDINMFWQIINFGILIYIFKRFLFKPMTDILKKRKVQIDGDIEKAKKDKEDSLSMREEIEKQLKETKVKNSEFLNEAVKKAEEIKDDILKEAHATREKMVKAAEADIMKMKDQVKKELRSEMTDIAIKLAEKMISEKMNVELGESLVDQFIEEVGEIK